jgi:hypothetical protein
MRPQHSWLLIGTSLLVVAVVFASSLVFWFFASGECVSSGGSYDYLAHRCNFSQNHAFVPFYRTWSFWFAAAFGVAGSWAIGRGASR